MRRNIRSARAQISVNCAGGIENIASMTCSHPTRGWLERSSISSKTLASVLYAAQTGTVLPVSETVESIEGHLIAVADADFSIASTADVILRAIDGPQSGGNLRGALREVGLVVPVGRVQVRMRACRANRPAVNEEHAVAGSEGARAMRDDDHYSVASE